MSVIRSEDSKSHNRRQTIFDAGKAKGIEEAEEKAALEIAVLNASNDALHKCVCQCALVEQAACFATGELFATQASARLFFSGEPATKNPSCRVDTESQTLRTRLCKLTAPSQTWRTRLNKAAQGCHKLSAPLLVQTAESANLILTSVS